MFFVCANISVILLMSPSISQSIYIRRSPLILSYTIVYRQHIFNLLDAANARIFEAASVEWQDGHFLAIGINSVMLAVVASLVQFCLSSQYNCIIYGIRSTMVLFLFYNNCLLLLQIGKCLY